MIQLPVAYEKDRLNDGEKIEEYYNANDYEGRE